MIALITTWRHNRTMYEVLGVRQDAIRDQIKSSFRKLAKHLHPDTGATASQVRRFVELVKPAYEILRDPARRRVYDETLIGARRGADSHKDSTAGGYASTASTVWSPYSYAYNQRASAEAKTERSDAILSETMSHIRLHGVRTASYDTGNAIRALNAAGSYSQASVLNEEWKARLLSDAVKSIKDRGARLSENDVRYSLERLDQANAKSKADELRSKWAKELVNYVAKSIRIYGIEISKGNVEYASRTLRELGREEDARGVEEMYESARSPPDLRLAA